jgi:hypothetical protein
MCFKTNPFSSSGNSEVVAHAETNKAKKEKTYHES